MADKASSRGKAERFLRFATQENLFQYNRGGEAVARGFSVDDENEIVWMDSVKTIRTNMRNWLNRTFGDSLKEMAVMDQIQAIKQRLPEYRLQGISHMIDSEMAEVMIACGHIESAEVLIGSSQKGIDGAPTNDECSFLSAKFAGEDTAYYFTTGFSRPSTILVAEGEAVDELSWSHHSTWTEANDEFRAGKYPGGPLQHTVAEEDEKRFYRTFTLDEEGAPTLNRQFTLGKIDETKILESRRNFFAQTGGRVRRQEWTYDPTRDQLGIAVHEIEKEGNFFTEIHEALTQKGYTLKLN